MNPLYWSAICFSVLLSVASPPAMAATLPMNPISPHSIRRRPNLAMHHPVTENRGGVIIEHFRPSFAMPVTQPSIVIRPGTSAYGTLRAPSLCTHQAPCQVFVEAWYDHALPRDRTPDLLLLAGKTMPDPFAKYPEERSADSEAFQTRRDYHFLSLPSVSASEQWHFRLVNNGETVFNPANATVRVSVQRSGSPPRCPSGPGSSPCSGRGDCVDGTCACQDASAGRYCETLVRSVPADSFVVPADGMGMFKFVPTHNGNMAAELKILEPRTRSLVSQPIMVSKRLGEAVGSVLRTGAPLPNMVDTSFSDRHAIRTRRITQRVVAKHVQEGEAIFIGVFNYRQPAPAWLARRHPNVRSLSSLPRRSVRVSLRVFQCADNTLTVSGLPLCPSGRASWRQSIAVFAVPLVLAAFLLIGICVRAYDEQEHDDQLDSDRKKMSAAETDAMYPAFPFTKNEAGALCAVGDMLCQICQTDYEDGESVRRLHCGHVYHASCISYWLARNATCPHCRRSARLNVVLQPRLPRALWIRFLGLIISPLADLGTSWPVRESGHDANAADVPGPDIRRDDGEGLGSIELV